MSSRDKPARRAAGGTPDAGASSDEPARRDVRAPEPGALIGQYRIVSRIGAGGMGTVYVGEHTLIGRRAAIKVLQPELSQRREIVDRFFNEARAAAAIKHPGIVQIFDFGFAADGSAYLVMELLDGKSLAATLRERGPLPPLDALRVIRQVATSMARAHAAGVIHRDLKPDNIFLVRDPDVIGGVRVKILDFGVAKLSEAFQANRTEAGGLFGTPLYMAPEQFEGQVDERSDIYTLGCVMYELLLGTPPFQGVSLPQLLRSHTSQRPAVPSSVRPAVRPAFNAIVLRCLEKDPGARFSSMTELAEAIYSAVELYPDDPPAPARTRELASGDDEGYIADDEDESFGEQPPTLIYGETATTSPGAVHPQRSDEPPGAEPSQAAGERHGDPTAPDGLPIESLAGPDAPAGHSLGRYQLVRKLASGGLVEIYLARIRGDEGVENHVTLKRIQSSLGEDDRISRVLIDEARLIAQLSHASIVQVLEFGQIDGAHFVAMEYVDGPGLGELLRRAAAQHVDLPLDACAFVARELASALDHVHRARDAAGEPLGIVHRGVSPDSVVVSYAGEVKLVDFHLARATRQAGETVAGPTAVGAIVGNLHYLSPEQASGDAIDHRSDIFSAGAVLHAMITGQRLYAANELTEVLQLASQAEVPPPSTLRGGVPPQLDRIVMRALARLPGERYPSAGELAADLDHFLHACSPVFTAAKLSDLLSRVVGPPAPAPDPAWVAGSAQGAGAPPIGSPPGGAEVEPPPAPALGSVASPALPPSPLAAQPGAASPGASPGATMVTARPSEHLPSRSMLVGLSAPPRFSPPPFGSPSMPGALPPDARRPDATVFGDPLPRLVPSHGGEDSDPRERGRSDPRERGRPDPLAAVFEAAVPDGFRSAVGSLVAFFAEMFATARKFADHVVELGDPAIEDLASRAHYVLFLDDITNHDAGPFGQLDTAVFRASVDPLTQQLEELDTPPGSVLIVILAAQLGQGARETIFTLRKERNLFVVPIAASEIRRECEAGNGRMLLINRIADLHTVSDPFSVQEDFIDPTRCIGFAAEVADLMRHITTGGKIVSVAGPPGSGKTSVVAMAEYGCDRHAVSRRFVRLSCGELSSFDPDTVIQELLEQVDRLDAREPGARRPRGSVPPGDASATMNMRETILRLGARATSADPTSPSGTQSGGRPIKRDQLVIVLEDADWLIRLASSSEPDAARRQRARELWRSLARLCSDSGYTVIVTSVRDFQVVDQVPLERPVPVSRVPMRALSPRESDRLVVALGDLVGFSPDRDALARLHHESGGNVYALRLLCSDVIRTLRERPEYMPLARLEVTAELVDLAARHIAATGSTFRPHVSVWLDDAERIVLQHIASERPRSPRQVRRALEGSADPERIGKALDGLELMGLVEFRTGRHRVRIPLFERWIDTHLEPPVRRRNAIREARASRVAIGCTVAALLFGAYWTVLRSTRSAERAARDDCTFELDHPDRVGVDETFALFVYQNCKIPRPHQLVVEPVLSSLHIPAPSSDCTPTAGSCTVVFNPVAREQAHDAYRVQLLVDGQPLASGAIEKDRFASVRSVGEKTVPQIAWVLPLLSVLLAFHKDLKRSVWQLIGRGGGPPDAPSPGPAAGPAEPGKP